MNPDDDLLSHSLGCTTIGAATFHFRVRDGIGWFHSANVARKLGSVAVALKKRIAPTFIGTERSECLAKNTLDARFGSRPLEVIW